VLAAAAGASGGASLSRWLTLSLGALGFLLTVFKKYDAPEREEFHRTKMNDYDAIRRDAQARSGEHLKIEHVDALNERINEVDARPYLPRTA